MTFAAAAVGIVGSGASMMLGSKSASEAKKAYKEAMQGVTTTLNANDRAIGTMMDPYRASGRKALNMLDAAISPTATRDYSMPIDPGKRPISDWRAYATLDEAAAPTTPAKPGLAGMLRK